MNIRPSTFDPEFPGNDPRRPPLRPIELLSLGLPRLVPIPEQPWHSPATVKLRDKMNREIQKVLARSETLEATIKAIDSVDVEQLTVEHLMFDGRRELIELLLAELAVRNKIPAFGEVVLPDLRAAHDAAIEAWQMKTAEVAEAVKTLFKLDSHQRAQLKAQEAPEVFALKQEIDVALGRIHSAQEGDRLNAAAIDRIHHLLNVLRLRAITI